MEKIDALSGGHDWTDEPTAVDPARWVQQHADSLYAYAVSRLRDPDAAEEVVQETFLAALKNAAQFAVSPGVGRLRRVALLQTPQPVCNQ